jgi:hypothetical protein
MGFFAAAGMAEATAGVGADCGAVRYVATCVAGARAPPFAMTPFTFSMNVLVS